MLIKNRFFLTFFALTLASGVFSAEKNYNSIFYSDDAEKYFEAWSSDKVWSKTVIEAQKFYKEKKYNRAILLYERALAQGYRGIAGLSQLAHSYEMKRQTQNAVKTYKVVLEELQDSDLGMLYEANLRIGLLYAGKKDFAKASNYLEQARLADPNQPELLYNLGVVYQKQKKYEEALSLYEATLGLAPNHSPAKKALKKLLAKDDLPNLAPSPEVFKLKPHISISEAPKETIATYRSYLRKNPRDPIAHYNLAVLYDNHLKHKRKAIYHYRRYLQLAKSKAKDADDVGRRIWILQNYRKP